VKCGRSRLDDLTALIDANEDFSTYTTAQKALVAELAGLATTMAAVIACPIIDEGGLVTALSDEAITAASALAARLAA
jgi:hypothetical protein